VQQWTFRVYFDTWRKVCRSAKSFFIFFGSFLFVL
jgi:hypothetical protein